MSIALPMCPNCQSDAVMKNDRTRLSCRAFKLHIRGGRDAHPTRVLLFFDIQFKCRNSLRAQNYKCRDCGRQFVEDPQWRMISEETKGIIDPFLGEVVAGRNCPCLGDIRKVGATIGQCQIQQVQVRPKPKRRLAVLMDQLWSFVGNKGNNQWVWLALDAQTRDLVGVHIGNRSSGPAQAGVAVDAPGLPPMCSSLQRLMVSLCGG